MKSLTDITTALENVRKLQATAATASATLNAELQKVNDGTRSAEYVQQQTAALRAKHTPPITEALQAVNVINTELSSAAGAWQDKRHVLSQRALTVTAGNWNTAKDPALEAVARLAKMTELAKMPGDMLHGIADSIKADPHQHGLLHLVALENNSRDTSAPGWQPISTEDIDFPDRTQALTLITEAAGIRHGIENMAKGAVGGRVDPADRITAARMGGAR